MISLEDYKILLKAIEDLKVKCERGSVVIVEGKRDKIALKNLGIKIVEVEGFEADDVISTLAIKAKENGFKVVIFAGDKDLACKCYNLAVKSMDERLAAIKNVDIHPENLQIVNAGWME